MARIDATSMPAATKSSKTNGGTESKKTSLSTKPGIAVQEVDGDDAAEVAADDAATLVAEHVVDEQVEVAAPRREVVDVRGRQIRVAVAAQVGRDHLIARVGQRGDVAPPDAFRLGVAVQQKKRIAADAFVDERERQPVAAVARRNLPPVDRERVRCRSGGLRRAAGAGRSARQRVSTTSKPRDRP